MGISDISALKPEVGPDSEFHVISLSSGRPPRATCTCTWKSDPSTDMMGLAVEAANHSAETGHVLRKHDA